MNDKERAIWVENTEGLYRQRIAQRKGVTRFVRENREEIDQVIKATLGDDVFNNWGKKSKRKS